MGPCDARGAVAKIAFGTLWVAALIRGRFKRGQGLGAQLYDDRKLAAQLGLGLKSV